MDKILKIIDNARVGARAEMNSHADKVAHKHQAARHAAIKEFCDRTGHTPDECAVSFDWPNTFNVVLRSEK